MPAIYSLVADYSDDATRGSAFGWISMAQSMGHVAGNYLGVLLAATSFLGVPGWRLAFYALALAGASAHAGCSAVSRRLTRRRLCGRGQRRRWAHSLAGRLGSGGIEK
ncbi:hypothetical protein C2845_PM01G07910 [Panicum miliaceum]|uniref:Major facilitator superfamily (MFS) profile domain-containing protein n=1 Tax=Panicum miliaceum TaxID=4540 RepID=A0A3L6TJR2_PANMI|nr:hypothetical protein C2845_PM01G07910 [Panicum miliaceum]